jgi:hypothetical protein
VVERYTAGSLSIPDRERDWMSAAEIAVLALLEAGTTVPLKAAA